MTRRLVSLITTLVLAMLCSVGCAFAESAPITITDMKGREITFDEPVTRIVALSPSDCEIIYALGAADTLVGRGEFCDYPAEVLDVPVVKSGAETNIEQILVLNPQVVVMTEMAQSQEQVQALENAGVKVVISDADDIEGVYTAITIIGAILGRDAEAEALIGDMRATFDKIAAGSENTGKTVYFEVSPLEWGLWTAGSHTFMDEIASMCGLTNIFAEVEGWVEISEEQVITRNPDYIITITMYYGEGPTPVEEIMGRTGWDSINAVANGDVYNADSNEISRPGPRLKDAALGFREFINAE